ncbi:MAG: YfhO family protein [Isosphaeraceae bacterium]
MSRRLVTSLLVVGCPVVLALVCFGKALFSGEQFGYRDAAHFYYPLYQRVQAEWQAGRWPLWEPEENGGMPLMGNPTAAVLYPGKIIYALLPYAWGARIYVVAHTLLAFGAMLALLRWWRVSWVGSTIGGLAYAFSGPILFQYCNVIYLVGAAWAPLGFRAVDRWLRFGKRLALLELTAVLAMEVLGGDPEVAYLTGLAAGAYAIGLTLTRRTKPTVDPSTRPRRFPWIRVTLCLIAWFLGTLLVSKLALTARGDEFPPPPLPWMPWVSPAIAGAWALAGLILLNQWRRSRGPTRPVLVPMLTGLAASAALAGAVTAAQLIPVFEFTGQSVRAAGEGPHDIYPFSLSPLRIVEFFVPNPFGTAFEGNRSWLSTLPPKIRLTKVWVPTLYVGGLTLVLALGASRFRRVPPWRAWIAAVGLVSLLGSLGEFTGPLFWARSVPTLIANLPASWADFFEGPKAPGLGFLQAMESFGPPDAHDVAPIRHDLHLRDGDGGFYWLLATILPGFRQFRFPSKLLTLTVLAIAALAGAGWDDLMASDPTQRKRTIRWGAVLLGVAAVGLALSPVVRAPMIAWLESRAPGSPFGPLDAPGAFAEMRWGLAQGAAVLAFTLLVAWRGHRRAGLAGALALVVLTGDLAMANAQYVLTVPQALFEGTPRALALIEEAEKSDPSPTPYRIHRMPIWNPLGWSEERSEDRVRDFVAWERSTLQPKYGINEGVHFTMTVGVAELYDYEWFFGGFPRRLKGEALARSLGVPQGTPVIYFPRRGFDLWTSRYLIIPYYPNKWTDENRSYASFLHDTRRIHPAEDAFLGPEGSKREVDWVRTQDFQIFRNLNAYPRAWVVHGMRRLPWISGMRREERKAPMEEILFENDPIWTDASRPVYNPREVVWIEQDDVPALGRFLRGTPTRPTETVTVVRFESDRIELDVQMETPGMVVLAEVFYPGWTLTIDGEPAPIYRANRMMRGAAVEAGRHRLSYTFQPRSFQIGLAISAVGLACVAILAIGFIRRPVSPSLANSRAL